MPSIAPKPKIAAIRALTNTEVPPFSKATPVQPKARKKAASVCVEKRPMPEELGYPSPKSTSNPPSKPSVSKPNSVINI